MSIVKASTSTNTNIVFPCKLCSENINDRDAALQFDICQFWVHLRCNKLNLVDYKYLQGSTDPWLCLSCCSVILPFGNLTDKDFSYSILNNYIAISNKNSSVLLTSPPNLALLFNQFNNSSPKQQIDPENVVNSSNFDTDQIQSVKFPQKEKSLSLFHINAYSLNKNFDDLVYVLKYTNKTFAIIAVSETRISKKTSAISIVNLNSYSFESTPTESSVGGAMLYVSNHLSYKPQTDLNVCKKINSNSKKSNVIVGCVYKHLNMDVLDFNYLINQLLDKISKEQKQIFLLEISTLIC